MRVGIFRIKANCLMELGYGLVRLVQLLPDIAKGSVWECPVRIDANRLTVFGNSIVDFALPEPDVAKVIMRCSIFWV